MDGFADKFLEVKAPRQIIPEPVPFNPTIKDQLPRIKNIAMSRKAKSSTEYLPEYTPLITKVGEVGIDQLRRNLSNRGILKNNNLELEELFKRLGNLDKAKQVQKSNWDKLPLDFMNKGAVGGAVLGATGQ